MKDVNAEVFNYPFAESVKKLLLVDIELFCRHEFLPPVRGTYYYRTEKQI